ncbi:hypothetical protein [Lentzea sp. CA-135723]|uniref:hypothetical protein n=1 Tax=Lentzea sp. CA-135723 TaxID=3239950 RepID=UPI003D8FC7EB
MTSREEAERLLSSLGDEDLVEIDSNGKIYAVGKSPAAAPGKSIAGISDQRGEYRKADQWTSG